MKVYRQAGDLSIAPTIHIYSVGRVVAELYEGYTTFGGIDEQSMWRLTALEETCLNLRTAPLDDSL